MTIVVRMLASDDAGVLANVADGVFDDPVRQELAAEYVADARLHLAVALEGDLVVGMASGVHYPHPDKPAQLFINEVGVASSHQRRGLGRRLIETLLAHGRELGCHEAWVATEADNEPARQLYVSTGGIADPTPAIVYTYRLSGK
jgi:ribosomal protein S18 acetylase RimI-like enzyme